jgi:hypothetical protein
MGIISSLRSCGCCVGRSFNFGAVPTFWDGGHTSTFERLRPETNCMQASAFCLNLIASLLSLSRVWDPTQGLLHRFYQYDPTFSNTSGHGNVPRTWGQTVTRDYALWEDWPGVCLALTRALNTTCATSLCLSLTNTRAGGRHRQGRHIHTPSLSLARQHNRPSAVCPLLLINSILLFLRIQLMVCFELAHTSLVGACVCGHHQASMLTRRGTAEGSSLAIVCSTGQTLDRSASTPTTHVGGHVRLCASSVFVNRSGMGTVRAGMERAS